MAKPVVRLIIAFVIIIIVFTVMGSEDLIRDAGASFMDIDNMTLSDFKEGDIICGTLTETLGCAATMETTEYMFGFIETSKRTSAYYYVIPFYKSPDDIVPNKIILYRTANKLQVDQLDRLLTETISFYSGEAPATYTRVTFERGEVNPISSEELKYFREFVGEFVDAAYGKMKDADKIKLAFEQAMVGYVVQYTVDAGKPFLIFGICGIVILTVVAVVVILKSGKPKPVSVSGYTYIGSSTPPVPPAPTVPSRTDTAGMANTSYNYTSPSPARPNADIPAKPSYTSPYASSGRQVPPITDRPISRTGSMPVRGNTDAEGRSLITAVFGSGNENRVPTVKNPLDDANFGRPNATTFGRASEPTNITGDTMGSVDPRSSENVDLSNGGIQLEDRTWGNQNAAMPRNGDLPVINPERYEHPLTGGTETVHENIEVQPIAPATSRENVSLDFQVEQTDPSMRNMYNVGGSLMQSVDPYTETNVDLSNGGRELPEPISPEMPDMPVVPPAPPVMPDIPASMPTVSEVPRVSSEMPTVPDVPRVSAEMPDVPDAVPAASHWDEIRSGGDPWDSVHAAVQEEINEAKADPWKGI